MGLVSKTEFMSLLKYPDWRRRKMIRMKIKINAKNKKKTLIMKEIARLNQRLRLFLFETHQIIFTSSHAAVTIEEKKS